MQGAWHWHVLDGHAQVTDRVGAECAMEVGHALRLGATPDAGPRSTCALRKGNAGDMCEQSLAGHPFHPCCCQYGGSQGQTAPCGPTHPAQAH